MFGTRQGPPRRSGRSILALSTLALLAFCCLPALASASSAGYQYEDAPQTATGKPPSESDLSGGSSSTSGVGSGAVGSKAKGGSGGRGGTGDPSSKGADRSGAGSSTGKQPSQGKGGNPTGEASGLPLGSAPGTDDGGSPLVPILIAIAVLAAGSIAYLVAKRRRAGEPGEAGSPASPEAG